MIASVSAPAALEDLAVGWSEADAGGLCSLAPPGGLWPCLVK
jgi:hypothetical protein